MTTRETAKKIRTHTLSTGRILSLKNGMKSYSTNFCGVRGERELLLPSPTQSCPYLTVSFHPQEHLQ